MPNIGDGPATGIDWSITVTGGILNRINSTTRDSITELESSSTEEISSKSLFGLGSIHIVINTEAENSGLLTENRSGYIVGPFVVLNDS